MPTKADLLKNLRQEFRKGTFVIAVLSQLTEKHYCYSLVERLNGNGLEIDQNTLYPLLRRLDTNGLLESSWEVVEPRPRKYYILSNLGKEVLIELKEDVNNNFKVISKLLEEVK